MEPDDLHGWTDSAAAARLPAMRDLCDCHTHVFGPPADFPYAADRTYTPGQRSTADLLAMQAALGFDRVVLVQPSPYGTDNACMVAALRELGPKRARGVAVIDAATTDTELAAMHAVGVRGVRINLFTAGRHDPKAALAMLTEAATRVAPLGWHVQTYTDLAVIAALHDEIAALPTGLVVDHFGRAEGALGVTQPGFGALLSLVKRGAVHVKLSAAHRLSKVPDHADMAPLAKALIAANPARMLWGSDWPHSGRAGDGRPATAITEFGTHDDARAVERLKQWAGEHAGTILVSNPARLYGF